MSDKSEIWGRIVATFERATPGGFTAEEVETFLSRPAANVVALMRHATGMTPGLLLRLGELVRELPTIPESSESDPGFSGSGMDGFLKEREHQGPRRPNKSPKIPADAEWEAVDWSMSNREIAKALDVNSKVVGQARKRFSSIEARRDAKHPVPEETWTNVDWRLSNREIAKMLDVGENTVWCRRKRLDSAAGNNVPRFRWRAADWSLSNMELALKSGVTKATVAAWRQKRNMIQSRATEETDVPALWGRVIALADTLIPGGIESGILMDVAANPGNIDILRMKVGKSDPYFELVSKAFPEETRPLGKRDIGRVMASAMETRDEVARIMRLGKPREKRTLESLPQNVDWSRKPKELAEELGVSVASIYIWRKLAGFAAKRMSKRPEKKWGRIDWSRKPKELAEELCVSVASIYVWRKLAGFATKRMLTRPKEKWDRVDWTLSNTAIAQALGVTRCAVWTMRRKLFPDGWSRKHAAGIWASVDWSKSDAEIAKEFVIPLKTVIRQREKMAGDIKSAREKLLVFLDSIRIAKILSDVDWSKSNRAIAKETGINVRTVTAERFHRFGKWSRMYSRKARNSGTWENVDWSKPDSGIANELGVGVTTVRNHRRLLGNPHRPIPDWENVDWSKTDREIADRLLVHETTVRVRRTRHAPGTIRRREEIAAETEARWGNVDWSKSSAQLARELGVSICAVLRQREKREGK